MHIIPPAHEQSEAWAPALAPEDELGSTEFAATRLKLRDACSTTRERIQDRRVSPRSLRVARQKGRPIFDRPGPTERRAR